MRRQRLRHEHNRRGISLVVVMIVLSTAIVLAVSFLHTQASAIRAAENGRVANHALEAAEIGIATALEAMQDPAWPGVQSELTAEVLRDEVGFAWYWVTFEKASSDAIPGGPTAAALAVRIRSRGRWQVFGSSRSVERELQVTVALTPRLPGRPARPYDILTASDRSPDVAGFEQAQSYGLFAAGGSDSLETAPQTRIAGDVWIGERLELFDDLSMSSTEKADLLSGIGSDHGGGPGALSPHPLAGAISFYRPPGFEEIQSLGRLNVPWRLVTPRLPLPAFGATRFRTYSIYAGGFQYEAAQLGSVIQNISLGPTDDNPLALFYVNGSCSVRDNVSIQGTLIATSGVAFDGRHISITPVDRRDANGFSQITDDHLWPTLPSVVSGSDVTFSSRAQVFLEGPVVAADDIQIEAPNYVEETTTAVYTGTATARPIGQGLSEVQVTGASPLSGLSITDRNAVRLNGPGGRWHPVVSADASNGLLVVLGNADYAAPVEFVLRPRCVFETDITGPLIASRVRMRGPESWQSLSGSAWDSKHEAWQEECDARAQKSLPTRTFAAYLADPANWSTAPEPYRSSGLRFEPTIRIARPANVTYACEPPLFRPHPSVKSDGGGYRWKVLAWREVPR